MGLKCYLPISITVHPQVRKVDLKGAKLYQTWMENYEKCVGFGDAESSNYLCE